MEEEELKDLGIDVKEWFLDQVELDCDCMNVESEAEGDDDSEVFITLGYHTKDWSVADPDGKVFETETALEEYLKEKIVTEIEVVLSRYDVEYSDVDVTVTSMFDFSVTIEGKYVPKEDTDEVDSSDMY
jgi:hypothetical protein